MLSCFWKGILKRSTVSLLSPCCRATQSFGLQEHQQRHVRGMQAGTTRSPSPCFACKLPSASSCAKQAVWLQGRCC